MAFQTVFKRYELKKKYEKVVYKRRLPLCEADAMAWVRRERACPVSVTETLKFWCQSKKTVWQSFDKRRKL